MKIINISWLEPGTVGWWVIVGKKKKENKFQCWTERRNSEMARSKGTSLAANQDKSVGLIVKRSHWTPPSDTRKVAGMRSHLQGSSPALAQQATVANCLSLPLTWRLQSPPEPSVYLIRLCVSLLSFSDAWVRLTWTPYLTGSSHSNNYQLRQAEGSHLSSWLSFSWKKAASRS